MRCEQNSEFSKNLKKGEQKKGETEEGAKKKKISPTAASTVLGGDRPKNSPKDVVRPQCRAGGTQLFRHHHHHCHRQRPVPARLLYLLAIFVSIIVIICFRVPRRMHSLVPKRPNARCNGHPGKGGPPPKDGQCSRGKGAPNLCRAADDVMKSFESPRALGSYPSNNDSDPDPGHLRERTPFPVPPTRRVQR